MLMIITISVVINNTNTKSKTTARIVLISSAITVDSSLILLYALYDSDFKVFAIGS